MKNMLRLHKEAGCKYGELALENLVMHRGDLGSVRLIDFKRAQVHHHCKYGDRHARVCCPELNELEDEMEIFKAGGSNMYATFLDLG
jgi:hypothetical protein